MNWGDYWLILMPVSTWLPLHSRLLFLSVILCRALSAKKYVQCVGDMRAATKREKELLKIYFGEQALDFSHHWLSRGCLCLQLLLSMYMIQGFLHFCISKYSQCDSDLLTGRRVNPWDCLTKTFLSTKCGVHYNSLHLEYPSQIWLRNWLKFTFCTTRTSCRMPLFCAQSLV